MNARAPWPRIKSSSHVYWLKKPIKAEEPFSTRGKPEVKTRSRINFLADLIERLALSNLSQTSFENQRWRTHVSTFERTANFDSNPEIGSWRSVGPLFAPGSHSEGRERAPTNDCHSNAQNFEYRGHRTNQPAGFLGMSYLEKLDVCKDTHTDNNTLRLEKILTNSENEI